MRNQDWSTLDIGEAGSEAWFYSKVTVSSCVITSVKTQNTFSFKTPAK